MTSTLKKLENKETTVLASLITTLWRYRNVCIIIIWSPDSYVLAMKSNQG